MPSEESLPSLPLGIVALWVGFLAALAAAVAYFLAARAASTAESRLSGKRNGGPNGGPNGGSGNQPAAGRALAVGRGAFLVMAAAAFLSAAYLSYLILTHRFDVLYVIKVSSRNQLPFYLFASFWGDQQGSFYLWLLHTSVLGLILMKVARKYEAPVMAVLSLLPACIFWILILKSPFKVLDQPWPDGQGMSPLLENPWMTIHPPVLFLGFAATTVLYAYAVAGLWRRDYDGWAKSVMPWTCFAFAVLGCGVCMGGYWAYSTLGWGGFWGWDPVENSSLFPWIGTTMLMHGLIVQRVKGTWHRTNLFLALAPFVAVLYSTFLTRSGILSEFSVHSFGSLGILWWLFGGIALFALLGLGMLALRWRDLPRKEGLETGYTLESAVYWGLVIFALFGVVVIVATSWPVLSGLMAEARSKASWLSFLPSKPASPDASWYNRMATPLGIMLAAAMGTVPLVRWSHSDPSEVWRKARWPLGLSLAVGAVGYALGVHRVPALLLLVLGAWALFSNARVPARRPGSLPKYGAYVAHVGLGMMLIGIVGSSIYDTKAAATLVQGEKQRVGGYEAEFVGFIRAQGRLKQLADIRLTRNGETIHARPTVHLHQALGRENQWITWPYVKKYLTHDLYIAPAGGALTTDDLHARAGEVPTGRLVRDGQYSFMVDPNPTMVRRSDSDVELAFNVVVHGPSGTEQLQPTVLTHMATQSQEPGAPAVTSDGRMRIRIASFGQIDSSGEQPSVGTATLTLSGPAVGAPAVNKNVVQVEISSKPLINLVWLGTILIVVGGLLSARQRMRDLPRSEERGDSEAPVSLGAERPLREGAGVTV